MFEGILQAITKPKQLFGRFEEEPKLVSLAFLVILIVSVLTAIVAYLSSLPTADAFPADLFIGQITLISAPIIGVVFTFLAWLIYGLLIRMTAGMDANPWAIAAYASAPQMIILTLLIVLAALFPVDVTAITASPADADAFRAANAQLQQEVQSSLFGRSSQILSYLGVAWQLLLVYLGVNAVSSQAKAIRSTVLVGIFALAFLILPVLLAATA